jgi:hypothetical protein
MEYIAVELPDRIAADRRVAVEQFPQQPWNILGGTVRMLQLRPPHTIESFEHSSTPNFRLAEGFLDNKLSPVRAMRPDEAMGLVNKRNWRLDLNRALSCTQRVYVDSANLLYNRKVQVENYPRAATPVPEIRKPFDVLAEGLVSENSRGDRI